MRVRKPISKPPSLVHILQKDNLEALQEQSAGAFSLIYVDPPFNTGKVQKRKTQTEQLSNSYKTHIAGLGLVRNKALEMQYTDSYGEDYLEFLIPRLELAKRALAPNGSLFVHLDYREVHYVKVELDILFGRECFLNEIIWSYDYGARSKSKWSTKHDTILWYVKNPKDYIFNYDAIDRIPYLAPELVGPEKAARGKTPTDVWWNTIVSPTGHEKTGYPTQKPLAIMERLILVHSRPGDSVMDFFAGSGSFGEAAAKHGRKVLLVDQNPEAIEVMKMRLAAYAPIVT